MNSSLGWTTLHVLAQSGTLDDLKRCLETTDDDELGAVDYNGFTAVQLAAHAGRDRALELLLARSGESALLQPGRHGFTALHIAAQAGRTNSIASIVRTARLWKCLSSIIDQSDQAGSFYTALHCALLNHHLQAAIALIESGADWSLQDTNGNTVLHLAVFLGDHDLILRLLSADQPFKSWAIDLQDNDGCTPLLLAVKKRRPDIVNLLLKHGARSTTVRDKSGTSPLFLALNDIDLVRAFVSLDCTDLCSINAFGLSAFHIAITREDTSLLDTLLAVATPSALEVRIPGCGSTPLHWAAASGLVTIVDKLILHGANVNAQDALGWTPMHRAIAGEHTHVVARLASSSDIDLNIHDRSAWTPLHMAALIDEQMVKILLTKRRIDVNAVNTFGLTPLHVALINGSTHVMELLMAFPNVDLSIGDVFGRTALQYAAEHSIDVLRAFLRCCYTPSKLAIEPGFLHHLARRRQWEQIAEIVRHDPAVLDEGLNLLDLEHIKGVLRAAVQGWKQEGGQRQKDEIAAMRVGLQELIVHLALAGGASGESKNIDVQSP